MALLYKEVRIWVPGRPLSLQASNQAAYRARVAKAARAHFTAPVEKGVVEIRVVFLDGPQRPDSDNVLKPILDALKGIVFTDDRLVMDASAAPLPNDPTLKTRDGVPHLTNEKLLQGQEFLIIVRLPDVPSITHTLRTS